MAALAYSDELELLEHLILYSPSCCRLFAATLLLAVIGYRLTELSGSGAGDDDPLLARRGKAHDSGSPPTGMA